MPATTWHALLIGVDAYPKLQGRDLRGCVNDVEAMRRFLLERVRVPAENLRCLTAPAAPGRIEATAENIRAAFRDVLREDVLHEGDHVVLHLSGHGVRLARAVTASTERYYGFAASDVEANVPGFANLVLDREIRDFLRGVEDRKATATLIADTCHAGSATRGAGEEEGERTLPVKALGEAQWQELLAGHPALSGGAVAPGAAGMVGPHGTYPGGDFVALVACRDTETAREEVAVLLADDGTERRVSHGVLTLALLRELARLPAERVASVRWMDFAHRVRAAVERRAAALGHAPQTPAVEGRAEKPVFGGAWRPFAPGFTVRVGEAGALLVDGGTLQGLDLGAVLAVHPPDTADFDDAARPGVEAVVVSTDFATSRARLRNPAGSVADRSRARLLRPGPATKPIVVRIVDGPDRLPDEIVASVRAMPSVASFFTLVVADGASPSPAHLEVRPFRGPIPAAVWPAGTAGAFPGARDGWVLVPIDRAGEPTGRTVAAPAPEEILAYLPGAGQVVDRLATPRGNTAEQSLQRSRGLGEALAAGLVSYARYLRARERRAVDDTLADLLSVRLLAGAPPWPMTAAEAAAVAPREPEDGAYVVLDSEWLMVEIRVLRSVGPGLRVGLLLFWDAGAISRIWPAEGALPTLEKGDVLHVGSERLGLSGFRPLRLRPRGDQRNARWTLRILAATGPVGAGALNLGGMVQPSVQAKIAEDLARARDLLPPPAAAWAGAEQPAWHAWDLPVVARRT